MWLHSWLNATKFVSSRSRDTRGVPRCPRRKATRPLLYLEPLEDRSVPSVAPVPIPGGALIPNPFGGPDAHFNRPGPADSTVPGTGGEPSTITDFNGFIGV